MPKRSRYATVPTPRKRYKKRKLTVSIPRPIATGTQIVKTTKKQILGKSRKATLRYAAFNQIDGSITPGVVTFRANGMFDPEVAVGGHQPRGFDQLMAFYDHFVVIGATITVYASVVSGGGSAIVSIQNRDSATAALTRTDVIEYGDKSTAILGSVDTERTAVLSHSVNIGKFLGRSSVMSDPELKGSAVGDPDEQAYFHVYAIHGSNSTEDAPPVFLTCEIEYTAMMIEPKLPGSS